MPSCHSGAAGGAVPTDLLLLFATGLTMSLGHCLGMCGPIQAAFAGHQARLGRRGWTVTPALLRYHLGRVLSYVLIGALAGWAGSMAAAPAVRIQAWLALVAGTAMAVLGLGLAGVPGVRNRGVPEAWGRPVTRAMGALLPARTGWRQLALGTANGFLPCGPVMAVALAAAASANAVTGGTLLFAYGLGTVPVLVGFGLVAHRLGPGTRERFHRAGAVLVVLVGVQLVLRGLAALEVVAHLHLGPAMLW